MLSLSPFSSYAVVTAHKARTTSVTFRGQEQAKDTFEPASSDDLKQQIQKHYGSVGNFLNTVEKDENLIGEGYESRAYAIPQMPAYVLSVSKDPELELLLDKAPGVNLGQSIAQAHRDYKISKRQKGTAAKFHTWIQLMPDPELTAKVYTKNAQETAKYREAYREYTEMAARIPQSGYDKLAEILLKIGKTPDLYFDADATNVLIDEQRGEFNLIDCQREVFFGCENLWGMLLGLTNARYVSVDEMAVNTTGRPKEQSTAVDPELVNLRRQITEKCILASYRAGLPVIKSVQDQWVFSTRQQWFFEDYLFRIAGLTGKWPAVYELLAGAQKAPKIPEHEFRDRLRDILDSRSNPA